MPRSRFLSLVMAMALTAGACAARKPGDPLKPGFNLFSKQQDVQLGQEAAQQIRQQVQVVQNQELQNYIQRIGQRLAQQQGADNYPYSFTLVNDPNINAFALPGGPTFINTGLILNADNEAQVAGVIGHEIAHVALRHGTNQASKANLIQLPALIAGAAAGGGIMGQLAQLGIGLGANSVLMKYSRDAESQSDALGARLMAGAGYNPIEAARFFEKLEAAGGSRGPQFLSSHPNPGNRMRAIEEEIRTFPQRQYTTGNQSEFERVKAMVKALPAPRQTQGQRGQAAPAQAPNAPPVSGRFRELRGSQFALQYPDNWQVLGDQNSSMVTLAPREGVVEGQNGQPQIAYGTIVAYFFPQSGRNLRDATSELVRQLSASNPTLQVASNQQRRVRVGNSEGLVTMLRSQSPYGVAETDALVTVNRPEGIFYMVFIAPERDFGALQSTFEQMIRSIRFA